MIWLTAIAGIAVAVQRASPVGLGTGRVLVQKIVPGIRWRVMEMVSRIVVMMELIVVMMVVHSYESNGRCTRADIAAYVKSLPTCNRRRSRGGDAHDRVGMYDTVDTGGQMYTL